MNKLRKDLMIVFGFSRENAEKAENLWRLRQLPELYQSVLQRIVDAPFDRMNPVEMRYAPNNLMNALNYKISSGEIR